MRNEELINYEYKAYQAGQRRRRRYAARHRAQAWRQRLIFLLLAALAGVIIVKAQAPDTAAAEPEQVTVKLENPDIPMAEPPVTGSEPVPGQVTQPEEEPQLSYLGEFRITHYCACKKCCGKDESDPWYGITATGTRATEGRTIAVDPSVIPYGSRVSVSYDDGRIVEYIAEDCGGAIDGLEVDVFIADHGRARELGVKSGSVYIVNEG